LRQFQQRGDHLGQAPGSVRDFGEVGAEFWMGWLSEQRELGGPADRGQRCADLVRELSAEPLLSADRVRDPVEQMIEGLAKLAEFVDGRPEVRLVRLLAQLAHQLQLVRVPVLTLPQRI
jgi:hypothetical protein